MPRGYQQLGHSGEEVQDLGQVSTENPTFKSSGSSSHPTDSRYHGNEETQFNSGEMYSEIRHKKHKTYGLHNTSGGRGGDSHRSLIVSTHTTIEAHLHDSKCK